MQFLCHAGAAAFATAVILLLCSLALAQTTPTDKSGGAGIGIAPMMLSPHMGLPKRIETVPLRMKLPYSEGKRYEVYQGNSGNFTHRGLNSYAWDFGLPEGVPVCAAAQGRVVRVKQDSASGGTSTQDYAKGNVVILDHGAGIFTQYLHLKKGSARVSEGQLVEAGEVLGLSGNTGFSTTPHLHFQVQDASGQSLPAAFLDVPGDGIPRAGEFYRSGNDGKATSPYAGESLLPSHAFAKNEIVLTRCDLPAHLLRIDKTYRLEGKVSKASRKVAIYVMSAQGGKALMSFLADVGQDGTFSSDIHLSDLRQKVQGWSEDQKQSNLFSFAIAPVEEDGSYWSNFSVPVSAR